MTLRRGHYRPKCGRAWAACANFSKRAQETIDAQLGQPKAPWQTKGMSPIAGVTFAQSKLHLSYRALLLV